MIAKYCMLLLNFCIANDSNEWVVFWFDVEHCKHFDSSQAMMYMSTCSYPRWANIPLQGQYRHVLTVGTLQCRFRAHHWYHFISYGLHGCQKALSLEKQTSSHHLTSEGSEHAQLFSVVISWDNKNEFQFVCEYGWFLLRQSHILVS